MKFIWVVSPQPTGRYRSFERRAWPECWSAKHTDRDACLIADIKELDGNAYYGSDAKRTDLRLKVKVFLYVIDENGVRTRQTRISKDIFKSIAECKDFVKRYFTANPHHHPANQVKADE